MKLIADVAQHLNDRIKDLVIELLGVIIKIMNCTNFNVAISFIFLVLGATSDNCEITEIVYRKGNFSITRTCKRSIK